MGCDNDSVGADVEPGGGTAGRRQRLQPRPASEQQHDDGQQDGAENQQNPSHHRLENTIKNEEREKGTKLNCVKHCQHIHSNHSGRVHSDDNKRDSSQLPRFQCEYKFLNFNSPPQESEQSERAHK